MKGKDWLLLLFHSDTTAIFRTAEDGVLKLTLVSLWDDSRSKCIPFILGKRAGLEGAGVLHIDLYDLFIDLFIDSCKLVSDF